VSYAVPVQVPKPLAELQAQRQSAGDRQLRPAELVSQRPALRKIGDQKRPPLVRTEGDDRETALVPETAEGPRLALEPGQLTPALDMALVPELKSGQSPIHERLDAKRGAVLGQLNDVEQPPAPPDDLMEKGVGPTMHCISSIG
jgi:hypothetical protein